MKSVAPKATVELRMRLVSPAFEPVGPGKIALLESIGRSGSISAAARMHDMSYSRAWKLVTEVNLAFGQPLVVTMTGGQSGGGAALTPFAHQLIEAYRETEERVRREAGDELKRFLDMLKNAATKSRRSSR